MKIEIQEISPIRKKILFELPQEAYRKALDRAYDDLSKKVQIKGFRKGKVPRSILERSYRAQTEMETVSNLVDATYRQAIQENSIVAVDMPKISDLKMEPEQPITFTAEVDVQPQVEAKDYEEINLKREKIQITDEEIENELKALQKSHAQRVPVEDGVGAQQGHLATIHYAGEVDGEPFEGGSAQNVLVEVGAGRFLPEFDQAIQGMKLGEKKQSEVTFPSDYGHEPLRGKKALFNIELVELKEELLPKLDDEFSKDIGPFQSLEEVKNEIKKHLQNAKEHRARGDLFRQTMDHLIEKNSFEIPPAMIDRELDYMLRSFEEQLSQQGLNLEKIGLNAQDYKTNQSEEAIRRIKGFLLFDSVAHQNKIEVAEEDLKKRFEEIAKNAGQPVEAVQKYYQENHLLRPIYNHILEEKTLEFLISKAKIEEK